MTIDRLRTAIAEGAPSLKPVEVHALAKHLESDGLIAHEWVSVNEKLPKNGEIVLVCGHEYNDPAKPFFYQVALFNGDEFQIWNEDAYGDYAGYWAGECYVAYWQPLPEAPE